MHPNIDHIYITTWNISFLSLILYKNIFLPKSGYRCTENCDWRLVFSIGMASFKPVYLGEKDWYWFNQQGGKILKATEYALIRKIAGISRKSSVFKNDKPS